jgi:nitroreductase
MNEVLKNIYERRSVRSYTEESVPEEVLREVIKAGFHAPNGRNEQGLRFVVITNRAKLKLCSDLGKAMSRATSRRPTPRSPARPWRG